MALDYYYAKARYLHEHGNGTQFTVQELAAFMEDWDTTRKRLNKMIAGGGKK